LVLWLEIAFLVSNFFKHTIEYFFKQATIALVNKYDN
jgi:hypothetical protein